MVYTNNIHSGVTSARPPRPTNSRAGRHCPPQSFLTSSQARNGSAT
ncbi:Uncharacterised protein [Mycobacteroides abscessus subsp. abscessus]|nr:Uncharacterised protein [Mycobacteroides abscessus subsp. abscessus]